MALVLHISAALLFYYLYQHTFRSRFDHFMGSPVTAKAWIGVYVKALAVIVLLPYILAELLLMSLLDPSDWGYNRTVMLLPYFAHLVADRRINLLLRSIFRA